MNSQQQVVFQPPINQPAEPTDDQIRQPKVLKRGNELSNENKKSAKRAKLDSDQKSKEEKEEIAYKELNERIKKERLVNQAYDDELFECIQNYVNEYRKAEKLKKLQLTQLKNI
jgi:SLT domain-containing protein